MLTTNLAHRTGVRAKAPMWGMKIRQIVVIEEHPHGNSHKIGD
jgi:hypothetical protein